jgi:tetratricopeptide (TPR) repeat protein
MSSISTTDSHAVTDGPKITGFVILTIVALAACTGALFIGNAPLTSPYLADWFDWLRTEPTWPVVFGVSVIVLLVGLAGMIARLISGVAASASRPRAHKAQHAHAPSPFDSAVSVPAEPANTRASLKFDAQSMAASGLVIPATAVEAVSSAGAQIAEPPSMEISTVDIQSLEPAIFSDNASDSFLTRQPEPVADPASKPAFDANAALSDTHGLQITTAQVIPIRPDIKIEDVKSETPSEVAAEVVPHDPVEAALLAEPAVIEPRAIPPSDISAVVSSARTFLDTPEGEAVSAPEAPATISEEPAAELSGFHAVAAAMEPADDQAVIRQAVQMALSVWPDATRAIAADELGVRVAYLYYDKAPQSAQAFQQIASGDLSAAANTLQAYAAELMGSAANPQAAEVWRVIGALNMGRDDPKALTAYENVSELDPTDANIHVYLARRYQMSGDTTKLLPVLQRALTVIGDPSTRLELLAPYADLKLKAGDLQAAGDAFEELGRLHETRAYLKPDDIQAKSAQGIALARGAQAREMQGAFDLAGPLYKKAHTVFSDLSAQLPEHAGLRSMAENAQRDAQRFQMA